MANWTVERVKAELPYVWVRVNGRVHSGQLIGRRNNYAVARIEGAQIIEVAWATIAHCLNTNRPIVYGQFRPAHHC